jgi:superfamily II DNA or RNA helicase
MKKVTIMFGPVRSKIIGKYPFGGLYDELSYRPPGSYFAEQASEGTWDGRVRMLTVKHSFPSGLLNRVLEYMKRNDIEAKVTYTFKYPTASRETSFDLNSSKLRGYQMAALNILMAHKRGILKIPTAGGKTVVAAALLRKIGLPAVFLSNQTSILMNAEAVFKRELRSDAIGFIGDQRREFGAVDICSVATLHKHLKDSKWRDYFKRKRVLIVDEVHHASAATWYNVCSRIPAEYRYGLSATPDTGPMRMKLEAAIGPVIFSISPKELMDKGYLSVPTVYMVENNEDSLPDRSDFTEAYEYGIVHSIARNKLIATIAKEFHDRNQVPICILGIRLDQIDNIKSALLETGLKATTLRGRDSSDWRQMALQKVSEGKIPVFVATKIFDEGVDIPSIRTLIIAGAHSKEYKVVQRIGRGLRIAKDKTKVTVVDFMDRSHDYLERHSRKRKSVYQRYEYEPKVVTLQQLLEELRNGSM